MILHKFLNFTCDFKTKPNPFWLLFCWLLLLLLTVCINLLFLGVQSEHSLGQGLAVAQRV